MFDQNGLRAGPSAPDPAPESGYIKQSETETGDQEESEPEVLREKGESKQMKLTMCEIKKDRRIPINGNARKQDVNGKDDVT